MAFDCDPSQAGRVQTVVNRQVQCEMAPDDDNEEKPGDHAVILIQVLPQMKVNLRQLHRISKT